MRRLEMRRLPRRDLPVVRGKPKISEISGHSGSINAELVVLNVELSIHPFIYRRFPVNSLFSRFKMVVPPYVHPFLLQLCDVWPSGRPSIRLSGPDVRRLPHFFLEQMRENMGSGGDKWG